MTPLFPESASPETASFFIDLAYQMGQITVDHKPRKKNVKKKAQSFGPLLGFPTEAAT